MTPAVSFSRPVGPVDGVSFAFDLCSAWTYLAAERVDQLFSSVVWTPVILEGVRERHRRLSANELRARRAAVTRRADALRMPLVWPERHPAAGKNAMRVAHLAAELGSAAAFVLAAGRLAYCGGFDLDDPEILTEAAAAAGLPLDACREAAADTARDDAMRAAGAPLLAHGADFLPVVTVRGVPFVGENRIAEAAMAARTSA